MFRDAEKSDPFRVAVWGLEDRAKMVWNVQKSSCRLGREHDKVHFAAELGVSL